MKKYMIILLLVLVISFQNVSACPPSFIEYGLRVQFEECDNVDGYLVDILFNKNDTDTSLYSSTLNEYYFYYDQTIRDIAQNDISQIPYLDYDQEWISYLAYFENGTSSTFYSDCTLHFGEDEMFQSEIGEFKVVILDETGNLLATSEIYSTSITPDHVDDHMAEMVVFNQTTNEFSLLEYEATYEIHECGPSLSSTFLVNFIYASFWTIFLVILLTSAIILFVVIVFLENILLRKESRRVQEDKKSRTILLAFSILTLAIVFMFSFVFVDFALMFFLVVGAQLGKIIFVFIKERKILFLSIAASIIIMVIAYVYAESFYFVF